MSTYENNKKHKKARADENKKHVSKADQLIKQDRRKGLLAKIVVIVLIILMVVFFCLASAIQFM